jgi:PemK-like, MazF-like toxin of type II toxin-antitoxin system
MPLPRPLRPLARTITRPITRVVLPHPRHPYPGDHTGPIHVEYAPHPDGVADPGEIVWMWVPYEENHRRGKDRPVLVIGRASGYLLALPLTSKDHDRDAAQEARAGRYWLDIGSGSWDSSRRPSEVRLDRVLRVSPQDVRRIGATLDAARFAEVAAAVQSRH